MVRSPIWPLQFSTVNFLNECSFYAMRVWHVSEKKKWLVAIIVSSPSVCSSARATETVCYDIAHPFFYATRWWIRYVLTNAHCVHRLAEALGLMWIALCSYMVRVDSILAVYSRFNHVRPKLPSLSRHL